MLCFRMCWMCWGCFKGWAVCLMYCLHLQYMYCHSQFATASTAQDALACKHIHVQYKCAMHLTMHALLLLCYLNVKLVASLWVRFGVGLLVVAAAVATAPGAFSHFRVTYSCAGWVDKGTSH